MSSQAYLYNIFLKYMMDGTIDIDTDTIKCMLLTSDYTFDATAAVAADILSSPSPEVVAVASPSNGYTTGGATLSNVTLTEIASPVSVQMDCDDIEWFSLTATFKWAVLYANVTRNGVVDPLIACIILDYEGSGNIIVSGVNYQIEISDDGLLVLGQA